MGWKDIITIDFSQRGGRPCIRGLRITVSDILNRLAMGMTHDEIISEFPELTEGDIRGCLTYAAIVTNL